MRTPTLVTMALNGIYDVGVIFSADTDLVPALEIVSSLKSPAMCEVACWKPDDRKAKRIGVHGISIGCHYFTRSDYNHMEDPTDYTARRRRR